MRRLIDELAHRLDDLDRAAERDEGDLRLLEHRDHRERGAGDRAADHGDYLVVLDEARREGAGLVGVGAVVIDDELELLAVDAALGVHLLDIHLDRLLLGLAEEGRRAGDGKHGADLEGVLRVRRLSGRKAQERRPGTRRPKLLHSVPPWFAASLSLEPPGRQGSAGALPN